MTFCKKLFKFLDLFWAKQKYHFGCLYDLLVSRRGLPYCFTEGFFSEYFENFFPYEVNNIISSQVRLEKT